MELVYGLLLPFVENYFPAIAISREPTGVFVTNTAEVTAEDEIAFGIGDSVCNAGL